MEVGKAMEDRSKRESGPGLGSISSPSIRWGKVRKTEFDPESGRVGPTSDVENTAGEM